MALRTYKGFTDEKTKIKVKYLKQKLFKYQYKYGTDG